MWKPILGQHLDQATAESELLKVDRELPSVAEPGERAGLYLQKAVYLAILNRLTEAKGQLRLALQQDPDDAETRMSHDYLLGSFYHQEERVEEAYALLTPVLTKYADLLKLPVHRVTYEDIQQHRAFELFRMRRYQEAVPFLEESLTFDQEPEDRSSALANLGIAYVKLKKYAEAKDVLLEACKMPAKEWEGQVHFYLAYAYAQLRLLRESKKEFQLCEARAAEYKVPLREVYYWLSRICGFLGEKVEAEHYARLVRPV